MLYIGIDISGNKLLKMLLITNILTNSKIIIREKDSK